MPFRTVQIFRTIMMRARLEETIRDPGLTPTDPHAISIMILLYTDVLVGLAALAVGQAH